MALPGSDLDIVILGASDELENPASGFTWDQRHALGDRLRALLKAMRKANLVAGKAVVIKARVPIIKCDLRSGVAVDVSLGAANGAAAVGFIQRQVRHRAGWCFFTSPNPRKWVSKSPAVAWSGWRGGAGRARKVVYPAPGRPALGVRASEQLFDPSLLSPPLSRSPSSPPSAP